MSTDFYKQLFHNMIVPVAVCEIISDTENGGISYRFEEVNSVFEKVTGFNKSDTVGKRIHDLFPSLETGLIYVHANIGRSDEFASSQYDSADSQPRYEISSFPVGPKKIALVLTELSSTKDNKQFLPENRQREKIDHNREMFFAEMNHELRAPLNCIAGMANLLVKEKIGEDAALMAELILKSSQKAGKLINNLLDCSRLECGGMTLSYEWVEIESHLNELMAEYRCLAFEKGIKLQLFVDPSMPKYIYTDTMRLIQILTNMVTNAVKFTEKGTVYLVCEAVNKSSKKPVIKFHVKDTGIGIRPEEMEKLFHRFSQLKSGNFQRQKGSGLGLVISRKLAQLMGGKINVSSEAGKGSTFSLILPYDDIETRDLFDSDEVFGQAEYNLSSSEGLHDWVGKDESNEKRSVEISF